jgi:hypothetical protein
MTTKMFALSFTGPTAGSLAESGKGDGIKC